VNQLNPADVFSPSSLDFGPRSLGITHELTTTLVVREALTVTQVRFDASADVFAAKTRTGVLRGTTLQPNVGLEVVVQFKPLAERAYDTAMVVVFADGRSVTLPLLATGRVAATGGGLDVSPSTLVFPPTEVGRDVVLPLTVRNADLEPQSVRTVVARVAGMLSSTSVYTVTREGLSSLSLPVMLMPGAEVVLDVHFRPDAAGEHTDELEFYAQGFDALPADILRVQGTGVAAGGLDCGPLRLEFGTLIRGDSRELTTTCTVSGGMYTVRDVALDPLSSPRFGVVEAPAPGSAFARGDVFRVRSRFAADGVAADHRGSVLVTSGLGQSRVIALEGAVRRPPAEELALAISVGWDASVDLDLHLVRSGAMPFDPLNDCFYQRKTQDWGQARWGGDDPVLDQDASGFGPEEVSIQAPGDRGYEVFVHFYTGGDRPTTARISLRSLGVEQATLSREFMRCGELWHVGRVDMAGTTPVFTPVSTVADARARGECP
jgi:hypothetical protein